MRRQLVLVSLAVTTMVVISFALPLGFTVARLADNTAAQDAEDAADQLARVTGALLQTGDVSSLARIAAASGDTAQAIFFEDRIIGDPLPHTELETSLELAWGGQAVAATDSGAHLSLTPVFLAGDTPEAVVGAMTPRATTTSSVKAAWAILTLLSVAMIGLAATLADRLGQRLVKPVQSLADGARQLAEGDLEVTVPVEGPPEIREAAGTFNLLGRRIRDLLQDERETIADLSHRLRTPLTALRLEMDGRAAADIVDDLSLAVDEIIREAREPQTRHLSVRTDVAALLTQRAAFWGALAEDEGRETSTSVPASTVLANVNPKQLGAAMDALLENVFAHTEPGSPYSVTLETADGQAQILVEDGGTGLPAGVEVLARGTSTGGSTGLGLDICARLARSAGGTFSVVPSRLGGAGFLLTLPI